MTNDFKKTMKVTCHIGNKKLCDLTWDEMPNIGMGFTFEKERYMIIKIEDSKVTVKHLPKGVVKVE